MERDVLLHIPHASVTIPEEWLPLFTLDAEEIERELLVMTDWFTDALFDVPGEAARLVFPVSRLLVDPERFAEDAAEPMAARGMGAVYTRTHDGRRLKSDSARAALMERYYVPHHRAMEAWVQDGLARFGRCLIVDCHSFPSSPLPCDLDQTPERPDICLGTAGIHSPAGLVEAAREAFAGQGYSVEVDRPYAGTMVPLAFYRKDARVSSLMVEVNRGSYMEERTGKKRAEFADRAADVTRAVRAIIGYWRAA